MHQPPRRAVLQHRPDPRRIDRCPAEQQRVERRKHVGLRADQLMEQVRRHEQRRDLLPPQIRRQRARLERDGRRHNHHLRAVGQRAPISNVAASKATLAACATRSAAVRVM